VSFHATLTFLRGLHARGRAGRVLAQFLAGDCPLMQPSGMFQNS
jgi:hypothetical protein